LGRASVADKCLEHSYKSGMMLMRFTVLMGLSISIGVATGASAKLHVQANKLMDHTRILSSDDFEGRGPGTPGEDKSVAYITHQFTQLGLRPGNPSGSYVQEVPLIGITGKPAAVFAATAQELRFDIPNDLVLWSPQFKPQVSVNNSEIVFVGYGVVAPEYGWDDFKDVDVRGKTILMLINDPAIPDPHNPGQLDSTMFKGKEMTYYGRWTYKFEIAAKKGAAAAIIIHETEPAAYPFGVVINSNARERFELKGNGVARSQVEGWIAFEAAQKLCAAGGSDLNALKKMALLREFKPQPLRARATLQVQNQIREIASRNVVALLPGSDAKRKNDFLIYTAHWDHLGRNPALQGDQIYNGALDNASGVAGLLELARVFATTKPRPKSSILFLAVTAEEKGLLGSMYYATHPLYPINQTLGNINMDGINPWGRTRDLEIIGMGKTTIEDTIARHLKTQGRVVTPDSEPEKGYYYRSDHFQFAKVGVPSIHSEIGTNFVGKPVDFGKRKHDEYTAHDYHKVSDEIKPDWDFWGGAEDLEVLYETGLDIANGKTVPAWKPAAEFHR